MDKSSAETVSETALNALLLETVGQAAQIFHETEQGESTVVYRVTLQDDNDVVVRVQKRGVNSFASESWAMQQCREANLPVPEVYGVGSLDAPKPLEAMVMAVARGCPLSEKLERLSEAQKATAFKEVGEALAKIHTVTLPSFGWLGGDKSTPDWPTYALTLLASRQDDVPMLERAGLSATKMTGLLKIVESLQELPYKTPILCHGDLATDHLFFNDELELVDVIDFGMVQGGASALDIGVFLMFHPDVKVDWLAEGYGANLTSKNFKRELLSHQINVAISYLAEALHRDDEGFKEIAVMSLRAWLASWRTLQN